MRFLEIKQEVNSELPLTRICFIKTKINHHELDEFIRFWRGKVDIIAIQKLINTHQGYDDESLFKKELQVELEVMPNTSKCPSPYQRLVIRNNGDVIPCCSFFGYNLVVGNIYENSLYEIWNSAEYKILRDQVNSENFLSKPTPCQLCILGRQT